MPWCSINSTSKGCNIQGIIVNTESREHPIIFWCSHLAMCCKVLEEIYLSFTGLNYRYHNVTIFHSAFKIVLYYRSIISKMFLSDYQKLNCPLGKVALAHISVVISNTFIILLDYYRISDKFHFRQLLTLLLVEIELKFCKYFIQDNSE